MERVEQGYEGDQQWPRKYEL